MPFYWHDLIARRHGLPALPSQLRDAVFTHPQELAARLMLGTATRADIETRAKEYSNKGPEHRRQSSCEAYYTGGMWALLKGEQQEAIQYLARLTPTARRIPRVSTPGIGAPGFLRWRFGDCSIRLRRPNRPRQPQRKHPQRRNSRSRET